MFPFFPFPFYPDPRRQPGPKREPILAAATCEVRGELACGHRVSHHMAEQWVSSPGDDIPNTGKASPCEHRYTN